MKFELAHNDLIKKILSCYIPDWQRYSEAQKKFEKDVETLEFKQDHCLFIATYRRHFSVVKYIMENSFDSLWKIKKNAAYSKKKDSISCYVSSLF